MYLYLAISAEAVASVLVKEDEGKIQRPLYYISKVLHGAEVRYLNLEKMIYALVISTQRLRPYFQAHSVSVLSDQPLRAALQRPDTSGRIAKWAVKLSEYDISYLLRPAMKAQVLADFLVECAADEYLPEERPKLPPAEAGHSSNSAEEESEMTSINTWTLHMDGASNEQGSGTGLVLKSLEGVVAEYALRFSFKASNNQAEYEALITGLRMAKDLKVDKLKTFSDSQLVVGQTKGEFEAKDPIMAKYLRKVKEFTPSFQYFNISHISRENNAPVDSLSHLASSSINLLGRVSIEYLDRPSIDEPEEVQ